MIKIIEKGNKADKQDNKIYVKRCYNCGTKFTYQYEDIFAWIGYDDCYSPKNVGCPECNKRNMIFIKRRYRGKL